MTCGVLVRAPAPANIVGDDTDNGSRRLIIIIGITLAAILALIVGLYVVQNLRSDPDAAHAEQLARDREAMRRMDAMEHVLHLEPSYPDTKQTRSFRSDTATPYMDPVPYLEGEGEAAALEGAEFELDPRLGKTHAATLSRKGTQERRPPTVYNIVIPPAQEPMPVAAVLNTNC